ncbi:MAG: branched chain amino acid aminotransferase, partial [Promethearchaeota archaeon]
MDAKDIDFYNLGFNFIETKMMFVTDYKDGKWNECKLVPFGPFE